MADGELMAARVAAQRAAEWQPWLVERLIKLEAEHARKKAASTELVSNDRRRSAEGADLKALRPKKKEVPLEVVDGTKKSMQGLPSFRHRSVQPLQLVQELRSLKSAIDFKSQRALKAAEGGSAAVPLWKMHQLAREMNMTLEGVVQAKEIFDDHDEDHSGRLSFDEIVKVIESLMAEQVADHGTVAMRIKTGQTKQLFNSWLKFVPPSNVDLNFEEFLLWYSCTGFMTDLLVDEKEKRMRMLAKKNGLDLLCMDRVRKSFTAFDLDRSGEVEEEEFENVLREVMQIPPHLQIPPSRIRFFWKEIDEDDSGKASFEEFLNWLCRLGQSFDRQGQLPSIEEYYASLRRIGPEYLDPPPELAELARAIQEMIQQLDQEDSESDSDSD